MHKLFKLQRSERDSNPRTGKFPSSGLANRPLQPLEYRSMLNIKDRAVGEVYHSTFLVTYRGGGTQVTNQGRETNTKQLKMRRKIIMKH